MFHLAVCIPTYNRADVLADRLDRMRRMQGRVALEICISDNASEDHTPEVAERYKNAFARFTYIRQRQLVSPTINFYAAWRSATFPYVTQIGDDDAIFEQGMVQALEMLDSEPGLQTVIGNNILYDFAHDKEIRVTEFVKRSERYTLGDVYGLFEKNYFFEYMLMRRAGPNIDYHNEGLSYPTGWRLLLTSLARGPIRLEPVPLILKGASSDQMGLENYRIEVQDFPRSDTEWFAGQILPDILPTLRGALLNAALMRTVRYSSDSTINANQRQKYLVALHHAQRAAAYDYDTSQYPKVDLSELVFGRLSEWLASMVGAAVGIKRIVFEHHEVCAELHHHLQSWLPKDIIFDCQPLRELRVTDESWVVSIDYQPHLAAAALSIRGSPYTAIADLITSVADSSKQLDLILAGRDDETSRGLPLATALMSFVLESRNKRLNLIPIELTKGYPIASQGGRGSARAFDGNPHSCWKSAERGAGVKGKAWIGFAFATPQAVRRIRLDQTNAFPYRQERVRVEKSYDDGSTWVAAAPAPFRIAGPSTSLNPHDCRPARLWRLVAAADNATAPEHHWAPIEIVFFREQDEVSLPPAHLITRLRRPMWLAAWFKDIVGLGR